MSTETPKLFTTADPTKWSATEWGIVGGVVGVILLVIIIALISAANKKHKEKKREESVAILQANQRNQYGYLPPGLAESEDFNSPRGGSQSQASQYQTLPESAFRGSGAPLRRGTTYGQLIDDETQYKNLGYGFLPDRRRDSDMDIVRGDE